ncbi:MAG TPA: InlB B-repeat-containing protein [Clostridia bacterium]|nr:InlB B-repeat-containing protein [Clostridia bacterium]
MDRKNEYAKIFLYFAILILTVSMCFSFLAFGITESNSENHYYNEAADTTTEETTTETQEEPNEEQEPEKTEPATGDTVIKTTTTTEKTTKVSVTTTASSASKNISETQNVTSAQTEKTQAPNIRKVFSQKASYAVTFNTNGGTEIKQQVLNDGDKIVKPENPSRNGFAFEGWFKDAKLTDAVDFDKDRIKGNVTVFAKWKSLAGTVTHKIIFKGNDEGGGYVAASPSEAVGGEMVILTAYPDKGKIIKAGTLTIDGVKTQELSFKMPEKDVMIYAEFEDAPIIKEESGTISKKLVATGVIVILLSVSLITIGLLLKQRNGIEGEPEWVDNSIVLSAYGDKKNQDSDKSDDENTEDINMDNE